MPADWADAEQLDGIDNEEKSSLVGVPFRIFSISFRTNASGNHLVEVDAENAQREPFRFTDFSSTGIRQQLLDYLLTARNITPTDGELFEMNMVFPRGLRVSVYEKEVRGKMQKAQTYYLTLSGVPTRAESATAVKANARAAKK